MAGSWAKYIMDSNMLEFTLEFRKLPTVICYVL